MKIELGLPDFRKIVDSVTTGIARAATDAMRDTTPDAKQDLRDQVVDAGLGARLANTWRGDVYPKTGDALNPAGYIHSNAPDIIDSFVRGATIVPVNGSRYLAIPTDSVPRAPSARGAATRRMSPDQVESSFNQDLIIRPGKNGHLLGFIDPTLAGRRIKRARGAPRARLVLMFTFVLTTRLPQLLELDGPAARWSEAFRADFQRRLI